VETDSVINLALLLLMIVGALWTVLTHVLLRSAIGLALVSALIAILMFRLHSPLAAVFELSVCTGLISVVFVSTISLTQRLSFNEALARRKNRYKRFMFLPILVVLAGGGLLLANHTLPIAPPPPVAESTVSNVLWTVRQTDLLGQILVLLAGVYGVVILFKEKTRPRAKQ
jgi:NADH-quinone oxidoreductase subunit J